MLEFAAISKRIVICRDPDVEMLANFNNVTKG
jgi:hypothetical protein